MEFLCKEWLWRRR